MSSKENIDDTLGVGDVVPGLPLADLTNLRIDDPKTCDETFEQAKESQNVEQEPESTYSDVHGPAHEDGEVFFLEHKAVSQYFLDNVPVALELQELRQKVSDVPFSGNHFAGDEYFKKQKFHTDNADRDTSRKFMNMMLAVADKMQAATGIFTLSSRRPAVLAFGFAPGGFVAKILKVNPTAEVTGITLGNKFCGIPVFVKDKRFTFQPADITLMAADMGILADEIPSNHPDANNFLPKLIRPRATFDLVTAEGGVLRPHQALLGSHREQREAHRLKASQLALSLSRVKQGGKMIVLLHKPETWNSLSLFYSCSKFAKIQLFKPTQQHQYKSSFYMLATDIQSQSDGACKLVKQWTKEWKVATFGSDEEYQEVVRDHTLDVEEVLREYGQQWIELSMQVWVAQRDGLREKSFTQE